MNKIIRYQGIEYFELVKLENGYFYAQPLTDTPLPEWMFTQVAEILEDANCVAEAENDYIDNNLVVVEEE